VNLAAKWNCGGNTNNFNNFSRRKGGCGGFVRGGKSGRGGSRPPAAPFQAGVFCQLCKKEGHTVINCFKRYDATFVPPSQKSASSAMTSSYGVDTN